MAESTWGMGTPPPIEGARWPDIRRYWQEDPWYTAYSKTVLGEPMFNRLEAGDWKAWAESLAPLIFMGRGARAKPELSLPEQIMAQGPREDLVAGIRSLTNQVRGMNNQFDDIAIRAPWVDEAVGPVNWGWYKPAQGPYRPYGDTLPFYAPSHADEYVGPVNWGYSPRERGPVGYPSMWPQQPGWIPERMPPRPPEPYASQHGVTPEDLADFQNKFIEFANPELTDEQIQQHYPHDPLHDWADDFRNQMESWANENLPPPGYNPPTKRLIYDWDQWKNFPKTSINPNPSEEAPPFVDPTLPPLGLDYENFPYAEPPYPRGKPVTPNEITDAQIEQQMKEMGIEKPPPGPPDDWLDLLKTEAKEAGGYNEPPPPEASPLPWWHEKKYRDFLKDIHGVNQNPAPLTGEQWWMLRELGTQHAPPLKFGNVDDVMDFWLKKYIAPGGDQYQVPGGMNFKTGGYLEPQYDLRYGPYNPEPPPEGPPEPYQPPPSGTPPARFLPGKPEDFPTPPPIIDFGEFGYSMPQQPVMLAGLGGIYDPSFPPWAPHIGPWPLKQELPDYGNYLPELFMNRSSGAMLA